MQTLEEIVRAAIKDALKKANGNRCEAARLLGISVRTIQRHLAKWSVRDRLAQKKRGTDN
jgi:DNA-binding NtrC family response regulator